MLMGIMVTIKNSLYVCHGGVCYNDLNDNECGHQNVSEYGQEMPQHTPQNNPVYSEEESQNTYSHVAVSRQSKATSPHFPQRDD